MPPALRPAAIALCLLALAAPAAHAEATASVSIPAHGFSLDLPEAWQRRETIPMPVFAAIAAQPQDAFYPNINVVVTDDIPDKSLAQITTMNLGVMRTSLPGFKVIEQGTASIAAGTAPYVVYECRQTTQATRNLVYLIRGRQKIYFLSGTASLGAFPKVRGQFEAIARSFRID